MIAVERQKKSILARLPAKEAELLREKAEVMNALISLKAYVKEDAE